MGFDQEQAAYILMIEQALRDALIEPEQDWPRDGIPRNLNTAMRYSLLAGGKRLRPTLLLAACHLLLDDVSMLRIMAPTLPGSCSALSATIRSPRSSGEAFCGKRQSAAIP